MAGDFVLGRNKQRGASLGRPTVGRCWSFLPKELAALLSPGPLALRQSVFLLIRHGATLREPCRQRIGRHVVGYGRICLSFVATKSNRAGGDDEDNEHHGSQGRKSFEFFHVHQRNICTVVG